MSVTLWIDTDSEKTIELGATLACYRAFSEMSKVAGGRWNREYSNLAGVLTQCETQDDADPAWLADVRKEASRLLAVNKKRLGQEAISILSLLVSAGSGSAQFSTFREEDHARANDGKFTSGGSGGSGPAATSESKSTPQRSQATAAYQERQKARGQKRQQIQSRREKLDRVQPVTTSGPADPADSELLSRMGLFHADTPKEEIDRAASVSASLGLSFAASAARAVEQITALTGSPPEKLQSRLDKGQAAVTRHTARLQKAHAAIEPLREKYLAAQAAIAELESQAPPEPESDASDSIWEAYERVQAGFDAQLEKLEAKRDSAEERLTDAIDRLSDVSGDLAEAVDRAEEDFDDELTSVLDAIEEALDSEDEKIDSEEADDEEPEEEDEPDDSEDEDAEDA